MSDIEFIEFEMPAGHTFKVEGEPIVEQPTPAARVMRGAQLMDREAPDWAESVNPLTLDLISSYHCVLGQYWGGYTDGLGELGLSTDQARELGFDVSKGLETGDEIDDEYAELEKAWRNEINARR